MAEPVIVAGARTPIGKLLGSLSSLPAPELAATAIRAALERAGITGGGIPLRAPAVTVNKLCLSGLTAIAQAAQQVLLGQADVVVAGGTPARGGASGTAESHARAATAIKAGRLAEEITPVTVPGRKGDVTATEDKGVRPCTTAERFAGLPPAFSDDGTITAGSASQLPDGACAVVVMSKERAERLGLPWLAEIGARLALSLAMELRRRVGGTGAAASCGGGGHGDALVIRIPRA